MPNKRIKQLILDLPFEQKILGAGAVLMFVSLFMPWYQDIDMFKTGDMFLGLTGPIFFAGYTIMLITMLDLVLIVSGALKIKLPISVRPSSIFMASGIIFFYLLFLVNSVYFHQKFGINLLNKESPFGMFIAFIAASLVTIGGYISTRDKQSLLKEFREQTQEPLIKVNEQAEMRKPRENLRSMTPPQPAQISLEEAETIGRQAMAEINSRPQPVREPVRQAVPAARPAPSATPANGESALPRKQPQPYRFDL